jgi:hypothetical protein
MGYSSASLRTCGSHRILLETAPHRNQPPYRSDASFQCRCGIGPFQSFSGQMLIKVPALEEGDYAIKYKVFAADGHLTEDVIRFKVSSQR